MNETSFIGSEFYTRAIPAIITDGVLTAEMRGFLFVAWVGLLMGGMLEVVSSFVCLVCTELSIGFYALVTGAFIFFDRFKQSSGRFMSREQFFMLLGLSS